MSRQLGWIIKRCMCFGSAERRYGLAVGLLAFSMAASGCASLQELPVLNRIYAVKATPPAPAVPAAQVAPEHPDSSTLSGLPTDTLMLSPEPGFGAPSAQSGWTAILRAPGSVELGGVYAIPGYRVQLASAETRRELEVLVPRVERELESKSYLEEHEGRWCLRLGDFPERGAAETLRSRAVSYGFKYAWIVQTQVIAGP